LAVGASALTVLMALRGGRRRSAINEALHELRRPLQAVVLAGPGARHQRARESSMRLAEAALDRLDGVVNGGKGGSAAADVAVEPILRAAVERWGSAAQGVAIRLRWQGGLGARVRGEKAELAQAVDNLIVNAIEHGGPDVLVEGARARGNLRVAVVDSGRVAPAVRKARPAPRALRGDAISIALARLTGRRRRGHGLAVVRAVAESHGGRFVLERGASGAAAVLELPLLEPGARPAPVREPAA
jgi:signal transduction histidine kinase